MEKYLDLEAKIGDLFEAIPLDEAMPDLCPKSPSTLASRVEDIRASQEVLCGLWLYVDDLDRSHAVSQGIPNSTGSYWHAIMHRREGDYANSMYWYRNAGSHPVITELGYDPSEFVDQCQADQGINSPTLVDMQRREWKALFEYSRREFGSA